MTDLAALLPQFVAISAGSFLMGTPRGDLSRLAQRYGGTRESYREESPQHHVMLPAFAITATLVTNALYAAFTAASNSPPPHGPADHPVVDVSWHEAYAFCAWISRIADYPLQIVDFATGQSVAYNRQSAIRLPTEAEWERVARGTDGRTFPWGEHFAPELANTREAGLAHSSPVTAYPQGISPHGAYDMAGNVWEWTATLERAYPYLPDDGRENLQAEGRRILRGGCYANPHGYARCACRFRLAPQMCNRFIGFRLAYSLN